MPAAVPPSPTPPPSDRAPGDPRPSEAAELELGALRATLTPVTPPAPPPAVKPSRPSLFGRLSFALTLALTLLAACADSPEPVAPRLRPAGPSALVVGRSDRQVVAGYHHSCALNSAGAVQCWGQNDRGQAPATRTAATGTYTDLAAGWWHTCAVTSAGAVECWGENANGQAPAVRTASSGVFTQVTAGIDHTCGLTSTGVVECWGGNVYGQAPASKTAFTGGFTQVSAGRWYTCAVNAGGELECWGINDYGSAPARWTAAEGGPFTQVSAGMDHTCALRTDGSLRCWGNYMLNIPSDIAAPNGQRFTQVSSGYVHSCAVTTVGTVQCWGVASSGQQPALRTPASGAFSQVSAGYLHTCARRSDGGIECFGSNDYGQTAVPAKHTYATATFSVAPSPVVLGQSFTLTLSDVRIPGVTAPVAFTYAFDCGNGAGYGPFGSSAVASCPTIFAGTHTVRAKVKDPDDETEFTGTIQVVAPSTEPAATSLLFWDLQNVSTAGVVSSATPTSALAGITGRFSQTCGGPAETLSGVVMLTTRRFGLCYPYVELTLTKATRLVDLTFDHQHNHSAAGPTFPTYVTQVQLDAGTGGGYGDIGNSWLLEGTNVYHGGADAAVVALNAVLQPGTYKLRWMPRGLHPFDRYVCYLGEPGPNCDVDGYEWDPNPTDTDTEYFALRNVRVRGYALWDFTGFAQPVSNLPTVNTAKAGSAIPVKFGLGGDRGLAIFAAGYPQAQPVSCTDSAPTDVIQQTVTAGASSLSYDAAAQQYTYVWKTDKAWANTCRLLTLKFVDGTTKSASFRFN